MTNYKPILKWVGGKTQIIDKITDKFPKEIDNYHEIFLGGGSVLLCLLNNINNGKIKLKGNIYAYDYNEPLIYVYKNIQTNHNDLYNSLNNLITDFNLCKNNEINRKPENKEEAMEAKENYYYWIRQQYNKLSDKEKNSIIGSAMFIFLNKTCFRGIFRIGPNGFNVPYGHYKNPEIINKNHLDSINLLIKNVIFKSCDFSVSMDNINKNDFVYLDPPYAPEKKTSFVSYTDCKFNLDQHNKLFNLIKKLNCNFMMSNSDVSLVRDNFENYKIESIVCKRSINSKKPDSKTTEVIITNY
jgi:DNA adenine methylase